MPNDRHHPDKRPSPDALLKAAAREEARAGRLKVFVGAAPGVGKTYAMLETARARLKDGYDVVAGVVETHGRRETEALLEGLEAIPRKHSTYKGRKLEEMDLDAILARRPQIVLVDELAHTNAPGSRHPKRYMDVVELLDQGIDVYTTVNIQHIESLNDVIAQITRVRVRETVPDAILSRADAVELIDITPEDLIARLKEGKVYTPKQAARALKHFFSPANLTALRELALRRTAEQVDAQLLTQMQAGAIEGPWPAGERVLVCVSADPRSAGLVRYAKRIADRLRAPFTALHVESRRGPPLTEEQRDRIAEALRLAQSLGGETATIPGSERRIAEDIVAYAQGSNITHIVIGKTSRPRWFEIVNGSVVHELVRRAGNISVHVIAGEAESAAQGAVKTAPSPVFSYRPYIAATLGVAASVGVGMALWPWSRIENIDLVFLAAIVGIAVRFGLWPSLYASVLATLAYNFFFTDPYYTFSVARPADVIAVIFFAIVALIVSNIAARARVQAVAAMARARTTERLYAFSRKLAGAGTLDDVLWATAYQTALMLKVRVVLLLPEADGTIAVKAGYPPEDMLGEADLAAANWAWENDCPAGRGADTLPGAKRLFLPMRTGRGAVGIVGIDADRAGPLLTPDEHRLLDALIDQAALAIERVHLVEDMDRVERAAETDHLRSALLTSISHDLKTPLAGIIGAAGTLKDYSGALDDEAKGEMLSTIIDESERLNRFIANLLDMTRIESGAVPAQPQLGLHYLGDIAGSALKRAQKITAGHKVEVDIPPGLPMLRLDPVLFEQVLFNLLDNAAKYAPPGSTIRIDAWEGDGAAVIEVMDEGPGIPVEDLERVFDTFYRVGKGDQTRAGTGLGLSICRGFVAAMGGTITAGNRADSHGAVFTILMPLPREED
ncbi:ATP-binding protein [Brucella sp. IR073]|uniref:ATP-binding protein n=1 Tax=unclassified Brucella TaxID=2632610 RepID=UPI003B986182